MNVLFEEAQPIHNWPNVGLGQTGSSGCVGQWVQHGQRALL